MNYIEQINGFWEKSENDNLSGSDIAVYFYLLHYANRLSWKETFICHWDIVCQHAKVSKNTYYKSMQTLHDLGYIRFEIGQKNVLKPKVSILKFKNNFENNIENRKGIEREQHEEQKGNLDKPINLETNKHLNPKTNSSVPPKVGTTHKKNKRLFSEVKKEDYPNHEQQYFVLARGFFDVFWNHAKELNLPLKNLNEANADEWTRQIRLMIESKEATEEQIIEVGRFLKTDSFWKTNVRSVPKLREKFENIYASTKKVNNGNEQKSTLQDPEFQAMVMAKFATSPNFQGFKND